MPTYEELLLEVEKLRQENIEKDKKIQNFQREIEGLYEILARDRRRQFGSSSEKVGPDQMGLFNEAEVESAKDADLPDNDIIITEHKRKNRGKRLPLPDSLPREDVIIDIDQKTCPLDGSELSLMGEDICEKLELIPARVKVIRTIRKKYSCPCCQTIHSAPLPQELVPKGIATPSLISYIAIAKYADAIPLYRMEQMLERYKIEISRQSMARWMIRLGEALIPIINLLREKLLDSPYIQMDETPVQVLKEDGKTAESRSYMWVQSREGPEHIILFHYAPTRSKSVVKELLGDYCGTLQVDGYAGYDEICEGQRVTRIGCWAHARRRFFDAFKGSSGSKVGKFGIKFIKDLYEQKNKGNQIPENNLDDFKKWMDEQYLKTTPSSLAGKALKYAIGEWTFLKGACLGNFRLDNNEIEKQIRYFAIGRKNWMFCDTVAGANASANIYSVVRTARLNKLDLNDYMISLITDLPKAQTVDDFEKLLPMKRQ
jgi:transposase